MGTPLFAKNILQQLVASSYDVVAVYTQPPRPKNRGKKIQKSDVHEYALSQNIPVETPHHFRCEKSVEKLYSYQADMLIVVAYGLILPQMILDATPKGAINIHPSLLPRWRGASPIEHTLLFGDRETGVNLMQMNDKCDEGDIIATSFLSVCDHDNKDTLSHTLSVMSAKLLCENLDRIYHGKITLKPQNKHGITYAHKIQKKDTCLHFHDQSATQILYLTKAFYPSPGCYFVIDHVRIKVFEVIVLEQNLIHLNPGEFHITKQNIYIGTKDGVLEVLLLQDESKKILDSENYIKNRGFLTKFCK